MHTENSCFLVAEEDETNKLVGSIYMQWSEQLEQGNKIKVIVVYTHACYTSIYIVCSIIIK